MTKSTKTIEIKKDSLFHLMTTGYVTLQVPSIELYFPGEKPETVTQETIKIPDDYLYELKYFGNKLRPTIGKEEGFLYITKKGYENLKPQIREAFLTAFKKGRARNTTEEMTEDEAWAVFEAYAQQHFAEIELCIAKQLKQYQAKVKELENLKA